MPNKDKRNPMIASKPTLFIFSGLPASGKSSLAKGLVAHLAASYLRIDTIEQGLRDLLDCDVVEQGYLLSHRIAAENLQAGQHVVCDSCNPLEVTRRGWEQIAVDNDVPYINIEVTCSDEAEHQRRINQRDVSVAGLTLPNWPEIQQREYHAWTVERCVIDTAGSTLSKSISELIETLT